LVTVSFHPKLKLTNTICSTTDDIRKAVTLKLLRPWLLYVKFFESNGMKRYNILEAMVAPACFASRDCSAALSQVKVLLQVLQSSPCRLLSLLCDNVLIMQSIIQQGANSQGLFVNCLSDFWTEVAMDAYLTSEAVEVTTYLFLIIIFKS